MNIFKITMELLLFGLAIAAIVYIRRNYKKRKMPATRHADENFIFVNKNNTNISSLNTNNTVISNGNNILTASLPLVFDLTRIRSLKQQVQTRERKFRKPVYRKTVYSEYFGQMAIIETVRETENPDEVETVLSPGLTSALAGIEPFTFEGFPGQGSQTDGNLFESAEGTNAYEMYLNDETDFDFSIDLVDPIAQFKNEGLSDLEKNKPARKKGRKTKKETKENGRSGLDPPDI